MTSKDEDEEEKKDGPSSTPEKEAVKKHSSLGSKLKQGSSDLAHKLVVDPVHSIQDGVQKSAGKIQDSVQKSAGKIQDSVQKSTEKIRNISKPGSQSDSELEISLHSSNFEKNNKLMNGSETSNHSQDDGASTEKRKKLAGLQEGSEKIFHELFPVLKHFSSKDKSAFDDKGKSKDFEEGDDDAKDSSLTPAMEPDETLENKMTTIITKALGDVSVQEWYDTCWSDEKEPFYGPWLEETGKLDVKVGEWEKEEKEEGGEGIVADWDQETYQRRRTVTFRFERKGFNGGMTHVKHTQYCRLITSCDDDDDVKPVRCILAMKVEMQGIPFADAFSVEIRWVATQAGSKSVLLQVALYVNFSKSCMVEGKIRSGTTTNTTKAQRELLDQMKTACGGAEVVGGPEADTDEANGDKALGLEGPKPTITVDTKSVAVLLLLCIAFHVLFGPWIDRIGNIVPWKSIIATLLFAVAFHFAFGTWLDQAKDALVPADSTKASSTNTSSMTENGSKQKAE